MPGAGRNAGSHQARAFSLTRAWPTCTGSAMPGSTSLTITTRPLSPTRWRHGCATRSGCLDRPSTAASGCFRHGRKQGWTTSSSSPRTRWRQAATCRFARWRPSPASFAPPCPPDWPSESAWKCLPWESSISVESRRTCCKDSGQEGAVPPTGSRGSRRPYGA